MKTIKISEDLAKTAIDALEWMSEDIEEFHLEAAEYTDDPKAEYDSLRAKQAAYDQAAAALKALLHMAQ